MNYDTALRGYTAKRIEEIESADILVGIPCYNNETTIAHVIQMVTHGLARYYKDRRSVILYELQMDVLLFRFQADQDADRLHQVLEQAGDPLCIVAGLFVAQRDAEPDFKFLICGEGLYLFELRRGH